MCRKVGEGWNPSPRTPVHSHDAQTAGQPSRGPRERSGQTAGCLALCKSPQGLALGRCAGGGANKDRLHFHLPGDVGFWSKFIRFKENTVILNC